MTQPRTVHDAEMADRYGTGNVTRRRAVIVVSGLVGIVSLVWLGWAVWFQSTPDVQSTLRTYSVVDDHTATATVGVKTRDRDIKANCLVQATGLDHSVVGELNFTVTGVKGESRHKVTLRTERPATSVDLIGCTTSRQGKPR